MHANPIDPRLAAIQEEAVPGLVKFLIDTFNLAQQYQIESRWQEANQLYNNCQQIFNLPWLDKDYFLNIIVNVYLAQSNLHWAVGSRGPAFRLAIAGLKYFEGDEQIPPQGYDEAALPPQDENEEEDEEGEYSVSDEELNAQAQEYQEFAQLMSIQASFHCILANYWATFLDEFSQRKAIWAFEIALGILQEYVPESAQIAEIEEAIALIKSGKLLPAAANASATTHSPTGEAPEFSSSDGSTAGNSDSFDDKPA